MEQNLKNYIDNVTEECLKAAVFSSLTEDEKKKKSAEIKRELHLVVFQTLLDNLAPFQLKSLENLDFADPESDKQLAELTATIPNFGLLLQAKLKEEVQKIKQTG